MALRLNINPILFRDTSLVRRPFLFTTRPVNFMFSFGDLGFLRVTWLVDGLFARAQEAYESVKFGAGLFSIA
jgi:hypothetical protein